MHLTFVPWVLLAWLNSMSITTSCRVKRGRNLQRSVPTCVLRAPSGGVGSTPLGSFPPCRRRKCRWEQWKWWGEGLREVKGQKICRHDDLYILVCVGFQHKRNDSSFQVMMCILWEVFIKSHHKIEFPVSTIFRVITQFQEADSHNLTFSNHELYLSDQWSIL